VTTEGRCYSFGRNDKGQLGLGDSISRNLPTLIKALENVKIEKAAIGKNHTFFLASTGEVWVAGSNNFGQLGLGKVSDSEDKARQQPSLGSKVIMSSNSFCLRSTTDFVLCLRLTDFFRLLTLLVEWSFL
jgi:alpha-tubulin suppressor-like RCC1 family protein